MCLELVDGGRCVEMLVYRSKVEVVSLVEASRWKVLPEIDRTELVKEANYIGTYQKRV